MTLKCDPDWAVELRKIHAAVRPGYHTNKRHWNTVDLDGTVDDAELQEMIEHSYELVVIGCHGGNEIAFPHDDRQRRSPSNATRRQNLKRVRPPGSVPSTTVAERGSTRYTCHGGGPCDGALNGAVMPEPLSSGSAGQPLSAHAFAIRATTAGSVTRAASPSMTTSASRIDKADRAARIAGDVAGLPGARACLEPERAIEPEGADRSHMRAAVLVHRRQPGRTSIVGVRSRRRSRLELLGDLGPVHWWESVPGSQVDDLHGTFPFVAGRHVRNGVSLIRRAVMSEVIAPAGRRAHVRDGRPTGRERRVLPLVVGAAHVRGSLAGAAVAERTSGHTNSPVSPAHFRSMEYAVEWSRLIALQMEGSVG